MPQPPSVSHDQSSGYSYGLRGVTHGSATAHPKKEIYIMRLMEKALPEGANVSTDRGVFAQKLEGARLHGSVHRFQICGVGDTTKPPFD